MKFSKLKNRAFTLLECLVALLVISGSVLIIGGLSKLARQEIVNSQNSTEKDWQIFCNQLRSELDRSRLDRVENNFLYVSSFRGNSSYRFGQPAGASDFRKSNADGRGYQPMLFAVKSVQISQENKLIKISLQLSKGGEKQFYYKFTENIVEAGSSSMP